MELFFNLFPSFFKLAYRHNTDFLYNYLNPITWFNTFISDSYEDAV